MFGKNVPIKPVYEERSTLNVISVFRTIQGEGPLAGEPAIFVRLAGCNLRCHFCDTEFTEGTKAKEIDALVKEIEFLAGDGIGLVVITGGEPLAQPITPFISALAAAEFFVQVETAGTVWQKGLVPFIESNSLVLVCSPKTASVHPMVQQYCEHFKYIVRAGELDEADGLPNRSTQDEGKECKLWRPSKDAIDQGGLTVWLQPCDEYRFHEVDITNLTSQKREFLRGMAEDHDFDRIKNNIQACVISAMKFGYRISFQLHKVLGVE